MLATLKAQAEVLGPVESLIADSGFCIVTTIFTE